MHVRELGVVLALGLGAAGCSSDPEAASSLTVSKGDDGVDLRALWTYRSFDVDVDLSLVTRVAAEDCWTTSHLVVNDALSGADRHELAPTSCTTLRLGEDGDIVMDDAPTGVDWTRVDLTVNTDTEVISLGPESGTDPATGAALSYTFAISSPPCGDGTDCDCGVLRRTGGPTPHSLPLGRVCD
jgi:hypothetical protein